MGPPIRLTVTAMNNDQPIPYRLKSLYPGFPVWRMPLQRRKGDRGVGQITKCDICGKIYNESYLGTHKRRSHSKHSSVNEPASLEAILSIYEKLPEDRKKEVLERLAAGNQTKS
jgi:hypothetical protein